MRFLSLNLWHGLTPSSPVAFEALEPVGRRQLREQLQLKVLGELQPDIAFLQEVNPSKKRAEQFCQALKMQSNLQPDLVGLKLFGLGLPYNLNSALVTLSKSPLAIKKLKGVSLTRPGKHLVHTWGSWQLKEERFALFSEVMMPKFGRVMIVNTHLHHGLESSASFAADISLLAKTLELHENTIEELQERMQAGTKRRLQEIEVLLETIQKLERRYEIVVVGGDFNSSPDSQEAGLMRGAGFRDAWKESHADEPGFTYDGTINVGNHLLQARFPLTLVVEDLSFSAKTKDALLNLARAQENRPRRIDYLWIRSHSLKLNVRRSNLIGLPDESGLAPSDHFGICADLEIE